VEGELDRFLVDHGKGFPEGARKPPGSGERIELHHVNSTVDQMMALLRQQLVATEEGVELIAFPSSLPVAPWQ